MPRSTRCAPRASSENPSPVTRSPDPGDARCVRFVLSAEGAARLAEARIGRTASTERRLRLLDDQQLAALAFGLPSLEALLVEE